MGSIRDKCEEECSVIADKGDIGFIDYEDDRSVCTYNPDEEGPVVISVPFPFVNEKPQSVPVKETSTAEITIKNTTSEPVELWKVDIYDSNPKDSFKISLMKPPTVTSDEESVQEFLESFCLEDRVLQPGESLIVYLSCKPQVVGLHTTVVHFDVGDDRIERMAILLAEDKISMSLAPNKPYYRERKKKPLVANTSHVDGYVPAGGRPSKVSTRAFRYRLPLYPIPEHVRELLDKKMVPDAITEGLRRYNYFSYFTALLNMEEIKMEEDMRGYDMKRIRFGKKGQFLTLEVPGLAERRPSLVYGDYVFAKLASADDETHPYQGYIYHVEAEGVHLKFHQDFHHCHKAGNLYNVQFTFNRVSVRKLYQAAQVAESLEGEVLFPSEAPRKRQIRPTQLTPISSILNEEQKHSVEMILGCKGGPPYVIYGPPGTGKTVTLVEAILQIYTKQKYSRLLVCAPSNSAADHILLKLLCSNVVAVEQNDVLRINATTRPFEDLKPELYSFCCFEDSVFQCPPLEDLLRYRIIISTYMSANLLYSDGIKRGHFSHIFLDEAGQASEPETMIPLSHLCRRGTVIVLAGDPMQLGPVIHSKVAETCGLGMSYLERLFEYEFYATGNENYVTKLVRNYRCHPEILHLPSKLFYNGELVALKNDLGSSQSWVDWLPNSEFPVFFAGIQGYDEREGSNPSWFNRFEVSKVVEIVNKLKESKGLNEEDIGIITPYRQQVLKLSHTLESLGYSGIKIGSVEQFQGQERQVIIISTVRSTVKHNEFDNIHCLGFLSNFRRFNVSITRARSLLIVVGNPHIIGRDTYWNMFLWRCVDNGSYEGCPLPERRNSLEENPTHESHLGYEEEYPRPSDGVDWERHTKKGEEYPQRSDGVECEGHTNQEEGLFKPNFDEDEWSDGWK